MPHHQAIALSDTCANAARHYETAPADATASAGDEDANAGADSCDSCADTTSADAAPNSQSDATCDNETAPGDTFPDSSYPRAGAKDAGTDAAGHVRTARARNSTNPKADASHNGANALSHPTVDGGAIPGDTGAYPRGNHGNHGAAQARACACAWAGSCVRASRKSAESVVNPEFRQPGNRGPRGIAQPLMGWVSAGAGVGVGGWRAER
jgi:hypothetical protein